MGEFRISRDVQLVIATVCLLFWAYELAELLRKPAEVTE